MLTLLHAADLHLDSPFAALPPEEAAANRKMQRELPERMVELAVARQCRMMLLAGDVFDGPHPARETVEALRRALRRFPGPVFVAPGNHDPYEPDLVWATEVWPKNVHIFSGEAAWVDVPELNCRVWGGGFTGPSCFDPLPQAPAWDALQIGVFHGDPENAGPYRALSRAQIQASGLDYLALGHLHTVCLPKLMGRTWVGWPGVSMGRGFDECGPCGVLVVRLDREHCQGEFCPLAGPRYETITMAYGETPVLPPRPQEVHCRLTVTGEADHPNLAALERDLRPWFLSLDLRDETVPVRDLWRDCGDGTLRGMALETLRADPQGELAARYLLAALEGGDPP